MTPRLASATLASALIRRVHQEGGSAALLARGEAMGGGMLILATERGGAPRFFERGLGPTGEPALIASGPRELPDADAVRAYWQRRRASDPDLWVIELDIAGAERFAAETMGLS